MMYKKKKQKKICLIFCKLINIIMTTLLLGKIKNTCIYCRVCISGIAFLYLHLYNKFTEDKTDTSYLQRAEGLLRCSLRKLKGRKLSFMCGDSGPLAVAAVIYKLLGKDKESADYVQRFAVFNKIRHLKQCFSVGYYECGNFHAGNKFWRFCLEGGGAILHLSWKFPPIWKLQPSHTVRLMNGYKSK